VIGLDAASLSKILNIFIEIITFEFVLKLLHKYDKKLSL